MNPGGPLADMSSGALVLEPLAVGTLDDLEPALTRAFERIRAALEAGEPVVVALDERDVQGVGSPAGAALAHGLLGLARALALEGRKPGWHVAVLSAPADLDPAERARWIERLAEPGAASGAHLRLGGDHLGRLPV
jgi:hypothetical protein